MADLEKVIKGLECCSQSDNYSRKLCKECPYNHEWRDDQGIVHLCQITQLRKDALFLMKAQEPITGETSDGYHTFNELYHHRAVLFSVIVANYPDRAWKSKKHYDGTMYEGMFIVGIDTPDGQATYHYDVDPYWDMFKCRVLDYAPEWDGHTPTQAIERIGKLKAQEARVMTYDEMMKAEICFLEVKGIEQIDPFIRFEVDDKSYWSSPYTNNEDNPFELLAEQEEYLINARCWTSRPTDEQREAVKWD